jgi:hypothetical protein
MKSGIDLREDCMSERRIAARQRLLKAGTIIYNNAR